MPRTRKNRILPIGLIVTGTLWGVLVPFFGFLLAFNKITAGNNPTPDVLAKGINSSLLLGSPAILIMAAGVALLIHRHLKDRPKPGHCAHCDYDLKGNETGVCPECGATGGNITD